MAEIPSLKRRREEVRMLMLPVQRQLINPGVTFWAPCSSSVQRFCTMMIKISNLNRFQPVRARRISHSSIKRRYCELVDGHSVNSTMSVIQNCRTLKEAFFGKRWIKRRCGTCQASHVGSIMLIQTGPGGSPIHPPKYDWQVLNVTDGVAFWVFFQRCLLFHIWTG